MKNKIKVVLQAPSTAKWKSRIRSRTREALSRWITTSRQTRIRMFDIPAKTKKVRSLMMKETNNTKIVSTTHQEERVTINKATRRPNEERTITKWMKTDMGQPCRIPLIFTPRTTGSMVIQAKKCRMCRSISKLPIQIRLLKHIRLTVRWQLTTKCTPTTNTSLSRTKASIECHQATPRSRVVVTRFSHIARCNMLRGRTQIFKRRWIRRVTTILIISMGIREEDRRMLTREKEITISTMNRIRWRWVSCRSIINSHRRNRSKAETNRLHVTEKLLTRARSIKKFIASNCWTKVLKSIKIQKVVTKERLRPINNLIKSTSI